MRATGGRHLRTVDSDTAAATPFLQQVAAKVISGYYYSQSYQHLTFKRQCDRATISCLFSRLDWWSGSEFLMSVTIIYPMIGFLR